MTTSSLPKLHTEPELHTLSLSPRLAHGLLVQGSVERVAPVVVVVRVVGALVLVLVVLLGVEVLFWVVLVLTVAAVVVVFVVAMVAVAVLVVVVVSVVAVVDSTDVAVLVVVAAVVVVTLLPTEVALVPLAFAALPEPNNDVAAWFDDKDDAETDGASSRAHTSNTATPTTN